MSAFNVKRMVKTTVVLVALAAVAAGSKIGYNYLVVNGPLMSEAGKLSARLTEAKELGMPTTKEEMETAERKEALAHYESFLALDKFLADKRDLLDATDGGGKLCAMLYEHPDQIKNLLDAASLDQEWR